MFNNCRGAWSAHTPNSIVSGVLNLLNCKELLPSEKESLPALTLARLKSFWHLRSRTRFTVRFRALPGLRPSLPSSLKRQTASASVCRDLEGNEIVCTLAKAGTSEVPEPSAPLTFLEIFSRTKHHNKTAWIAPQSTIDISVLVLEALWLTADHACSHPRVPRAHQAGLSRLSLTGVGLFESVRCHGPGLALLINGGVQQQQHQYKH
ncbi:hypothetical protein TNCV_1902771 [Trichonephila clavipes]|nr:hypothetical protein TNCV_1902771 [Trichonephila clavipes]